MLGILLDLFSQLLHLLVIEVFLLARVNVNFLPLIQGKQLLQLLIIVVCVFLCFNRRFESLRRLLVQGLLLGLGIFLALLQLNRGVGALQDILGSDLVYRLNRGIQVRVLERNLRLVFPLLRLLGFNLVPVNVLQAEGVAVLPLHLDQIGRNGEVIKLADLSNVFTISDLLDLSQHFKNIFGDLGADVDIRLQQYLG